MNIYELEESKAVELVRDFFDYDPETGNLYHRDKPRKYFNNDKGWKSSNSQVDKTNPIKGTLDRWGYPRVRVFEKKIYLHRLAWFHFYGCWPEGQLDHINRVKSDNRLINLRDVSNRENSINRGRYKNNTSGKTGVCFEKRIRKWQAQIKVLGRRYHLGYFTRFDEAVKAREEAEKKYGY